MGLFMQQFITFFIGHWFLCTLFVGLAIALVWIETQGKVSGMQRVNPTVTVNLINRDNAVVIDIRDRDLYNKGHIAGAIHMTHEEVDFKDMNHYREKPLIIVCTAGVNAPKLAKQLKFKGLTKLYFLQGGMNAWTAASLPVVKK